MGAFPILELILPKVGEVLDRLIPDKAAAEKAKTEMEFALNTAEIQGALAQIDLNKAEAANPNVWVAGWRPAIGWSFGAGFFVQFVLVPFSGYVSALLGHPAPPPIQLDPILWQVGFGVLGINIGLRTYEKLKGVAS